MSASRGVAGALSLALVTACGDVAEPPPPATGNTPVDGRPTVRFVDVTEASGLGLFRQVNGRADKPTIVESFGAGLALADLDGDGDLDVYLTNAGARVEPGATQEARDALFENDGRGRFTDATAARGLGDRGWTTGVEVADVDGDGRLDLFLTAWGRNSLLLQRADGTYDDVTEAAGLAGERWSTGACFLDFDRDGDLDLYVANHVRLGPGDLTGADGAPRRDVWMDQPVYFGPRGLEGDADQFFLNRGDGTFEERTSAVGVDVHALYSFEAVAFDADDDGWCDVYVASDSRPNLLWRNVEGERFEEQGLRSGAALSANGGPQAGMGVAVGDADEDGHADLFVTNFSEDYSTLYRGRGDGRFDDVTLRARLVAATRPYLGWSTGFDDLDLDGHVDLWSVNGHVFPQAEAVPQGMGYAQPNQVFLGDGDGRFREARDAGGGLAVRAASRGGAAGDLDGDGDLDLVVANLDGPPTVLRNDTVTAPERALLLRLVGGPPASSPQGARVEATVARADGAGAPRRLVRFVGTGGGFLSSTGPIVHLGLAPGERVTALTVRWSDGGRQELGAFDGGERLVVERRAGVVERGRLGTAPEGAR